MRQPAGTVTMVFTDIEGSTRLLERLGRERYAETLDLHRAVLRRAFERYEGYEVECEGDSFFVAFARAEDAVTAAVEAQQALASVEWPYGGAVRVRMGIHTGEPLVAPPKYVGIDVHRAARIMSAGHGGQVLLSQATRELLDDRFGLVDLGEHRLKDLTRAQRLYQLPLDGARLDFPPLRTLENRPTNLPVQPTPLVGRERELGELEALLVRDDVRLLTLAGTGGAGKTRLALHVIANVVDRFPNGAFFVNLASIFEPALVVPTIAQTLGLRELPTEPLRETLAEHLRGLEMVLLLDNFEQVSDAAVEIAPLLASAPGLKIVATSRTALHLSGEHIYDVPPLLVPSAAITQPAKLAQYDAVALFIQRAQAVRPDFAVTDENAPAIAEICIRLDGLPLALELAAARVRTLSPKTLLARLDRRLQLLTGGARDRDARQQTLRATIDWSYTLLSDPEKALFARLAVFVDGARFDAVEAVCDSEDLGTDVLDGVASLVDNSLVRQEPDVDGESRFSMLEALHEYARERLTERDEGESIRRRHCEHFEQVGIALAQALFSSEDAAAARRLDEESGNLRAALAWSIEHNAVDQATRLCTALSSYLYIRGGGREQQAWADQVLASAAGSDRNARRRLLCLSAEIAAAYGELEKARRLLDEALVIANELNDPQLLASVYGFQGHLAVAEGEYERACALYETTLGIESTVLDGDDVGLAIDHQNLGWALALAGDIDRAEEVLLEGLRIVEEAGGQRVHAGILLNLAHVALLRSDFAGADAFVRDAFQSAEMFADPRILDEGLRILARSAAATGGATRSARLVGAADALEASGPREVALLPRNDLIDNARDALGVEEWKRQYEVGHAMSNAEAVAFALTTDPA